MNRPNAFATGDIRPHSDGMAVPLGPDTLRAEIHGPRYLTDGWGTAETYTAIIPNGLGEGCNTNGLMARAIARTALHQGLDVSVVTYNDPEAYRQASYTEALLAVGRFVRERASGPMIWLPHSRGGISLTQAKDSLAEADAIQGVFGMANPYVPIDRYEDAWSFIGEVRAALARRPSKESAAVYAGFVRNVGRLMMRPRSFADMVAEVVRTDTSSSWNELSKTGVPVALAHYKEDKIVPAAKNLAGIMASGHQNLFRGTALELAGGHARPLLDPSHARIVLQHTLGRDIPTAA